MPFEWINLGCEAFGLVEAETLSAVLYWTPADVGEDGAPGGDPVVMAPAFYLVRVGTPRDHLHVLDGDNTSTEWEQALDSACRLIAGDGR